MIAQTTCHSHVKIGRFLGAIVIVLVSGTRHLITNMLPTVGSHRYSAPKPKILIISRQTSTGSRQEKTTWPCGTEQTRSAENCPSTVRLPALHPKKVLSRESPAPLAFGHPMSSLVPALTAVRDRFIELYFSYPTREPFIYIEALPRPLQE